MQIKQLASEIRRHIRSDFDPKSYGFVFGLAIVLVTINYLLDFERSVIGNYYGRLVGPLVYTLYYAIPYYAALTAFLLIKKQKAKLANPQLWIKSFLFLAIIGSFSSLSIHYYLADAIGDKNGTEVNYLRQLFGNLKKVIPYIITLFFVYLIYDKQNKNFYGLTKTTLSYRPFAFMLLMVLPLVVAASFLPDFQAYYPRFKYWDTLNAFEWSKTKMNIVFLICYGMDFISVELIFRGALVIGMVSLLGKEAILPMALVYMVFHFGKPLGETISSFFGGYILGVLSYTHRNINGGIVVHIGLAWMMELAAILQHVRTG